MLPSVFYSSGFSQEELDKQYSPSKWVRRMGAMDAIMAHVNLLQRTTDAAKAGLPGRKDVSYDAADPACTVHYFNPPEVNEKTPIAIYIHGGYWTAGILVDSGAFSAETVVAAGATLATVQYKLSPPNRIGDVVKSVRRAVAFIARENPGRPLYLFGHSAGAHLCAMVLGTDWLGSDCVEEVGQHIPIKGALLISGIFDLFPIKSSCVNQESSLNLSDAEVEDHSPFNKLALIEDAARRAGCDSSCFVYVAVGGHESPEFIRQSKDFHRALCERGIDSQYLEVAERDHFDVAEQLVDASSILSVSLFLALRGMLQRPSPELRKLRTAQPGVCLFLGALALASAAAAALRARP